MANNSVDLESQAFKIVFTHIAETFRKACDNAGVRPEMSESVFATFGEMVDDVDWVKEVQNKIEKGT
jgi:signal transduction protein with GAF and PtsI domain